MKKIKVLTVLCIFFSLIMYSQEKERTCGTMMDLEERMQADPGLLKRMEDIENHSREKVKQLEAQKGVVDIITIPVVVHVLYNNSGENISDALIQSQMTVLNDDFRRTNSDADNVWSQAADTQIEFCLATVDPNGNSTTGITRKASSRSGAWTGNDMKKSSAGGIDPWNTNEYLNMWVCDLGSSLLGFAQFPGGAAATDGVVMGSKYFGVTSGTFGLGRTTTHEVGHYLNLRHIWGDGACGQDDLVSDTPNAGAATKGCPTNQTTCGSKDMIQNYMDYSDDSCMNLYTLGQKNRMRAVLLSGGVRSSLALSNKCGTVVTQPTCTDGVQNGDETGVDCGGSCTACPTNNQYCDSKGTTSTDEYIGKVEVGSINKSSGASSYSDFTTTSTSLSTNTAYTITVTPTWTGTVYSEGYAAWIDYNNDGDFADANEQIWSKAASKDTPASGSFTVPSGATNGATRLRVAMKYNGIPTSCETFSYGEVEDYTVNIGTGNSPTCNDSVQNGTETGVDCGGSCTPCSTGNDKCEGVSAYDNTATYSVGDKVVFNNTLYERTTSGWTNLGPCGSAKRGVISKSDFSAYPNPLKGNILNLSSNTLGDVSYKIINMLGQNVRSGTINSSGAVNVEGLKVGLYMVQFRANNQTTIKRFIRE